MSSAPCGCDSDHIWRDEEGQHIGWVCKRHRDACDEMDRHAAIQPPIPQNLIYNPLTDRTTLVIGLGHKARQGKDQAAKFIVQYAGARGFYAKTFSFADALKAHCRVTYGMREKDPYLLQVVGTDVVRRLQPDLWVDICMATIAEQAPDVAVIPDLRFPNEVAAVHAVGGSAVVVSRLRQSDGLPLYASDRDPNHSSETALDGFAFDESMAVYDGDLVGLKLASENLFDRCLITHLLKARS